METNSDTIVVNEPEEFRWISSPQAIVDKVRRRLGREVGSLVGEVQALAEEVRDHVVGAEAGDGAHADEDLGEPVDVLDAVDEACEPLAAICRGIVETADDPAPAMTVGEIDRLLATVGESMPLAQRLGEAAFRLHSMLAGMTDYDHMECGKEDKYELQGCDGTYIVLDGRTLVAVRDEIATLLESCWLALQLARRVTAQDCGALAGPGGDPATDERDGAKV